MEQFANSVLDNFVIYPITTFAQPTSLQRLHVKHTVGKKAFRTHLIESNQIAILTIYLQYLVTTLLTSS